MQEVRGQHNVPNTGRAQRHLLLVLLQPPVPAQVFKVWIPQAGFVITLNLGGRVGFFFFHINILDYVTLLFMAFILNFYLTILYTHIKCFFLSCTPPLAPLIPSYLQ